MSVMRCEKDVKVRVVSSRSRQLHDQQRSVHDQCDEHDRGRRDRPAEKARIPLIHGRLLVSCSATFGFLFCLDGLLWILQGLADLRSDVAGVAQTPWQ